MTEFKKSDGPLFLPKEKENPHKTDWPHFLGARISEDGQRACFKREREGYADTPYLVTVEIRQGKLKFEYTQYSEETVKHYLDGGDIEAYT